MRPRGWSGTISSGMSLVASRMSNGNFAAVFSSNACTENSHSGKSPVDDGVEQVAALRIGIRAIQLHRFIPDERRGPNLGTPVKLDERGFAFRVHETEGVHAKAFHHAERARQRAVRHRPQQHVHAFGHQRDEIPEGVVRRGRLRIATIGLHLHGVDDVGKLDRILDEEDRDVVADQVEVAFRRVELDGKSANVARCVAGTGAARHGRKAYKDRGLDLWILQKRRARQLRHRLIRLKKSMRAGSARVDDALRDALVIEMRDLLAEDEVFEQRRAARCPRAANSDCPRSALPGSSSATGPPGEGV